MNHGRIIVITGALYLPIVCGRGNRSDDADKPYLL